MKKVIVSTVIIVSFIIYSYFHNKTNPVSFAPVTHSSNNADASPSLPVPSVENTSLYKDGEYTGPVIDAYYGNIQVKAVVQDGKLADVQFLQYPNDHDESIEINTRAMPLLRQEAIMAQSAEVDSVTRATDSSIAFKQSLSSALAQAK